MADDRYRWLDGAAAEKLLRGEPLEPLEGPCAQAEAERLAQALGALGSGVPVPRAPGSGELPGEAAALAAFRAARPAAPAAYAADPHAADGRTADPYAAPHPADPHVHDLYAGPAADTPLTVRLGAPHPAGNCGAPVRRRRSARPVRLALAATLAAATLGGAAFAAGSGMLRDGREVAGPGPALSVGPAPVPGTTAPGATGHPVEGVPADRLQAVGGASGSSESPDPQATPTPDAGTAGDDEAKGKDRERGSGGAGSGDGDGGDSVLSRTALAAFCRELEAGRLDRERRKRLERAAQGTRLDKFCERITGRTGADAGSAAGGSGGTGGSGGREPADPGDNEILETPPAGSRPGGGGGGGGDGDLPKLGFGSGED
jgi:hypothetical protein